MALSVFFDKGDGRTVFHSNRSFLAGKAKQAGVFEPGLEEGGSALRFQLRRYHFPDCGELGLGHAGRINRLRKEALPAPLNL